jgi:hypothetical protein
VGTIQVDGRKPGLSVGSNLQMMLIGRFCKLPKSKTVNYHMQVAGGKTGHADSKFYKRELS